MARRVDPAKAHLVTLVIYGFALGVVLFVVLFPKVVLFFVLMLVAAFLYAKLYGVVERRLDDLELGYADDDEEDLEPTPVPKPKKKRKTAANEAATVPDLTIPVTGPDPLADEKD